MNLTQYTEYMQTECSLQGNPILTIEAIKVDGSDDNSLKKLLCDNSLKSCDYIKFTNNEICFIEFSDFYEQLSNLEKKYEEIETSNITFEDIKYLQKRKLIISPNNTVKIEIQNKIAETILLYDLICTNCSVSEHEDKNKEFLICLCSITGQYSILFDNILRELQKKFNLNISIKMLIYSRLEHYINDRISV